MSTQPNKPNPQTAAVIRAIETPDPTTQTLLRQLTDGGMAYPIAVFAQQQLQQTVLDIARAAALAERRAVVDEIRRTVAKHNVASPRWWSRRRAIDEYDLEVVLRGAETDTLVAKK